jgi:hypothetical protein
VSTVTYLDLSYAALSAAAMPHISKYLALNKCLKVLALSGNRIGADGAAALVEGFELNRRVLDLRLANTQLSDGSLVGLLASFDYANAVRLLDVSANLLGNSPLAATWDTCNIEQLALECVDFSWNSLNHRHAPMLSRTVCAGSLLTLRLGWNNLGDMGVLMFCDAVASVKWCETPLRNDAASPRGTRHHHVAHDITTWHASLQRAQPLSLHATVLVARTAYASCNMQRAACNMQRVCQVFSEDARPVAQQARCDSIPPRLQL